MTRDELRFDELIKHLHLWPDEVQEIETLAERLGKEITIVREKLEDWLESANADAV